MCPEKWMHLRRPLIIAAHLLLIPVIYALAFQLQAGPWSMGAGRLMAESILAVTMIRLGCFGAFKLFRGWWRYAGIADLVALVKATTLSSALIVAFLFTAGMVEGIPRSVFLIDWGMTLLVFGGLRLLVRIIREEPGLLHRKGMGVAPTLIVGAGDAGEQLIRDLRRDKEAKHMPVVLVDDDPAKRGMHLHGLPVAGTIADLPQVVERYGIQTIIIAIPSAPPQAMARIIDRCLEAGVEAKTVPPLQEIRTGKAELSKVRDVQLDDLLGREPVDLNLSPVTRELAGKTVLITGGAGSIGSELARQIATLAPRRLVLLEQAESELYFAHLEIAKKHPELEVIPVIADITHRRRLEEVFDTYRPDWVLHAAAYKHVPMMEHNVREAVRNNVFGTLNTAQCAAEWGAEKFVLISTDKAVNPSSVMGATKRIAERLVLGHPALRHAATDYRAVRFGNVLGSNGSVIPLFKRQLDAGGPLTVTHPQVTRYFMTIPEAAQLVLMAAVLPEAAGRICMLDMGQPVKIDTLARNLIRLYGLKPGIDVQISYTGLRPGEKLYEELMSEVEATVPTAVSKIRVVQTDETQPQRLQDLLIRLRAEEELGSPESILRQVCALVPECVSPLRDRVQEPGQDFEGHPLRLVSSLDEPPVAKGA